MKNRLHILSVLILSLLTFGSCDYLDIVPDEVPTEEDAFKDSQSLQRYLYSCYSFIPNPRHQTESLDLYTADEVVAGIAHETFTHFPEGNYSASSPVISYWNTLFSGIRQCYLLLDNIESVPGVSQEDIRNYSAEATFLIAYYHFLLLRSYGPIMIIDRLPDINMPISNYPGRKSYDECVQWISGKFDEAIAIGLEPYQYSETRFYGRATALAAKSIKARMLLYAASPLFNGQTPPAGSSAEVVADAATLNRAYSGFINKGDGIQLINTTVNPQKWQQAADAAQAAIQSAENAGFRLAYEGDIKEEFAVMPEPVDNVQRRLRMTFVNNQSPEIIWADTREESYYGLQNKSAPFGTDGAWNCIAPTMVMLEMFYTQNGLPIDKDPVWNSEKGANAGYAGRYGYSSQSNGNGTTLNLNQNREPRFDAWVAYHNSYYEYNRDNAYKIKTSFKKDGNCGMKERSTNYSPTGYLNKKGQHPLNSRGGEKGGGNTKNYPWPVVRLAELYLNYAEALIEIGGSGNLSTAVDYIDKIRLRAGIPTVAESWQTVNPGILTDQNALRELVRQERTIELYLENHRFWDVRRWMQGTKYFNVPVQGLGIGSNTDAGFFKIQTLNNLRQFTAPQNYLMPLPIGDLDRNQNLVQNPGY